jgi:hypothetical protein
MEESNNYTALTNINELTNNLLDSLDTVTIILDMIQSNVININNNRINQSYDNLRNTTSLQDIKHIFIQFKNSIETEIEQNITCCHEWIHDSIDITPETSQNITYCKYCELTKYD